MGHHPPPTGFTWPVPPEDLDGEPGLFLEWNADGRVKVRQEPAPASSALDDETREADAVVEAAPAARGNASSPAAIDLPLGMVATGPAPSARALAVQFAFDAEPSPWNPLARERVTWLGIGTLIGLMLAASALPDAPLIDPAGTDGPEVAVPVKPASSTATAPPIVNRGAAPDMVLAATGTPAGTAARAPAEAPVLPETARVGRPSASTSLHRRTSATGATARAVKPAAPSAADAAAMLRQVHRYEAALTRLDASATHAAWPAADREALVKQYTGLREQRLRLERCSVAVPDLRATVTCRGTLSYRPRVGDHSTRTTRGTWQFVLERDGEQWVIDGVTAPSAASLSR